MAVLEALSFEHHRFCWSPLCLVVGIPHPSNSHDFLKWMRKTHHVNEGNSCQIRWMIDRIKTKCSPRWRIVWRWLLHFKFLFDRCYSSDLFLMWWCGFLKFNRSQFSSTLAWWVDWFCWDTVQYLDEAYLFWSLMNVQLRNWWLNNEINWQTCWIDELVVGKIILSNLNAIWFLWGSNQYSGSSLGW
jgi:hypothetical protein